MMQCGRLRDCGGWWMPVAMQRSYGLFVAWLFVLCWIFLGVAMGADGKINVFKADKLAAAAKKAREHMANKPRRPKPTSKAGKKAKKTGGDVYKKDMLQPYSYSSLGDIARSGKRQRRR